MCSFFYGYEIRQSASKDQENFNANVRKREVTSANADNTWQSNVGCYFWVLALQVECVELQNHEVGGRILLSVNTESHSKFGISSESHCHIFGIGLGHRRRFSVDHGSHTSSFLCSI